MRPQTRVKRTIERPHGHLRGEGDLAALITLRGAAEAAYVNAQERDDEKEMERQAKLAREYNELLRGQT